MPEMNFRVRWPDDSRTLCYSPSLIIKDYFKPQQSYPLDRFVADCREALNIASERVHKKFGFYCSSAAQQLQEIERIAARFEGQTDAVVYVEEFIE